MDLTLNMEKTLDAAIDSSLCVNCDSCGEICPVGAIKKAERGVEGISPVKLANAQPSSEGCPLGIVPQVLAEYIKAGRIEDAAAYLYKKSPLARICARVCDHFCSDQDRCRMLLKDPVNMPALERYLTDRIAPGPLEYKKRYREKIAVIGSGPAGLAAAHSLAEKGYTVTIFEKDQVPGGSMSWGIPGFRLDKDLLDSEIARILEGGIELRTGVAIGEDVTIEELREEYDAIIMAIGASKGALLNFEGTDGDMVLDGVSVLRAINLEPENEFTAVGDRVVVIGGSKFAADVSRTLARKGRTVTCVAMEEEDKLNISEEERNAMAAEGIDFRCKSAPRRIVRNNGQITEVEFGTVIFTTDESGKKVPTITDKDSFYIACDTVVFAVGRKFGGEEIGEFKRFDDGALQADRFSRTSQEKVFACGDITGSSNAVAGALSSGRKAADNVDAYLRGRMFPKRHAAFVDEEPEETVIREEIAMIRPAKESIIFSKSGKMSHEPAEDIVAILRDAGIEEEMPLLVDRDAEDFGSKEKVAIIGGGIAGIAAAISLAKMGYAPTLFEKTPYLGGRYRWLCSDKRIDSEGFDEELAKVAASGIEVITNASAGIKPSISELKAAGYGAILFAGGESRGVRPDIPGVYSVGIFEMVSLASRLARDLVINGIRGNAIVIGSDAMGVDVARKLKEYADDVTLVCRCSKEDLAKKAPVDDALEDGVNLVTGTELVGLDTGDGVIKAAELMIIEKDLQINVPCDTLVIGDTEMADTATIVARNPAIKANEKGALITDDKLSTPIKGVFSIGNFPMSAADVGREGAKAIDSFFKDGDYSFRMPEQEKETYNYEIIEGKTMSDKGFEVGRRLLSTKQAKAEAARYICTGYHKVDTSRCIGCGICTKVCPEGAIELVPGREVE